MPFHNIPQTLPMTSTLTAPLPLSTSCPPDDVSLLPNHALPSPTAPLLIPSASNSTLAFGPPVSTSQLTQHVSPSTSPNVPVGLQSTSSSIQPGATNIPSPSKWRVSPTQREILQAAFDVNPYPELRKKTQLASELGVTTTQVSKWFQHRRETLTRLGQFKAQYNRTRRTPEQLNILQRAFEVDQYPSSERLAQLEAQLEGVTAKQIKLWFKHRRKQGKKRDRPKSNSASTVGSGSDRSSFQSNQMLVNNRGPSHHSPQIHHPPIQTSFSQSFPPSNSLPSQQQYTFHSSGQIPSHTPSQGLPTHSNLAAPGPTPLHPPQPPPDSPAHYAVDNNNSNYYGYRNQGLQTNTPPSSAGATAVTLPSSSSVAPNSSMVKLSFSGMEEQALRAAHIVTDGKPTGDGLARLSRFLNRAQADISQWFSSENDMGNGLNDIGAQGNGTCTPGNPQFIGSPCLTQSDTPIGFSGQQHRKAEHQSIGGQNPDVHHDPEDHHGQGGQNQNQPIQAMSVEFSKQEGNISSTSNDLGGQQHQHDKSNTNMKTSSVRISEDRKPNDNEVTDSGHTCSKNEVVMNGNGMSPGTAVRSGSSHDAGTSKSLQRPDDQKPHQQPQASTQPNHDQQANQTQGVPVPPTSNESVAHRHQPNSSGIQTQTQQHGMYGAYMYSTDGGVLLGSQHVVSAPPGGGGQVSPMLAPLRYSGGSSVSGGYVTTSNPMWYQQTPQYK